MHQSGNILGNPAQAALVSAGWNSTTTRLLPLLPLGEASSTSIAVAKDRAAGSRSLGERGFHGLGRGSRPLSDASGCINLAIYWGTLRRQLLSRLGGTRQQPDYCLYCRWGRQALPGAHGRHDLELYGAALQRGFLSRLGAARRQSNHSINWRGGGRSLSDAQRRLALAIHQHALQRQLLSGLVETRSEADHRDFWRRGRLFV